MIQPPGFRLPRRCALGAWCVVACILAWGAMAHSAVAPVPSPDAPHLAAAGLPAAPVAERGDTAAPQSVPAPPPMPAPIIDTPGDKDTPPADTPRPRPRPKPEPVVPVEPLPAAEVVDMDAGQAWVPKAPAPTAEPDATNDAIEEDLYAPVRGNGPLPIDPEFARAFPEEAPPLGTRGVADGPQRASRTARTSAPWHARRGDPEFARHWPADEPRALAGPATPGSVARAQDPVREIIDDRPRFFLNEGLDDPGDNLLSGAMIRSVLPARGGSASGAATSAGAALAGDRPRFAIGEGLDDPDAQLYADDVTLNPNTAAARPDAKTDPKAKQEQAPRDDGLKRMTDAERKKALTEARARMERARRQAAEGGAKVESSDELDQRMDDLMATIEDQKGEWRRRRDEAIAKRRAEEEAARKAALERGEEIEYIHTRDTKAAQALQVLMEDRPVGRIQGTVIDAVSGQTLPARIKIVDATGNLAGAQLPGVGFWCDGTFDVPVQTGHVTVEVTAGRFRSRFVQGVEVVKEKPAVIEAKLVRPPEYEFARESWYLADLNLGVRAPEGALPTWLGGAPTVIEAAQALRGEGVDIGGLTYPLGLKEEGLNEAEIRMVLDKVAGENLVLMSNFDGPQHPFCGSVMGLGVESIEGLPEHVNDPRQPLRDYLEVFRQRGGLAVFTEFGGRRTVDPARAILPVIPRLRGYYQDGDTRAILYAPAELAYDTVVGPSYDALAFDGSELVESIWFNLLNEGYRVPIIGAGGGQLEAGRVPFAQMFLSIPGAPTRAKALAAAREGRSVVSFGPAVFVKVFERDKGPGETLPADGRKLQFQIQAYASMAQGAQLHSIEIIRNGQILHNEKTAEGMAHLKDYRVPVSEAGAAWYIVRLTERIGANGAEKRSAWSNPIYFEPRHHQRPQPAETRYHGQIRNAQGTPLAGAVTILEPGKPKRQVDTDGLGRFDVRLSAAGTLIFAAPGHDPIARHVFAHPNVQKALGAVQTERDGRLRHQLSKRALFGLWRLTLSDLEDDVRLKPLPGR